MTKYIFITGGVLSGLGKGIVSASTGLLIKRAGYSVSIVKIDPYINVDAGTMSPYAHGEVFVTEDGGETDMDIGHYERFLDVDLSRENNMTSGQIYYSVITKERRGEYLGQCVQIIPHVVEEIKNKIRSIARKNNVDVLIVEIGGTVGDIEGLPFQEAARQMAFDEGIKNVFYIHVALAPTLPSGELKTKPIQHSVQELRRIGIQPHALVVRSFTHLDEDAKKKLSLYSNIPVRGVYSCPFTETPYEIPLVLESQGYTKYVFESLGLEDKPVDLVDWIDFVKRLKTRSKPVKIAMIGKYTKLHDSYVSIIEAINHASAWLDVKPDLVWIESTDLEQNKDLINRLDDIDGAIILPGFGRRGAEGKINALRELREKDKPVLGICFGMQLMVIEAVRNILGLPEANSTEIDPDTKLPIVDLLPEQKIVDRLGGTLRLGSHKIIVKPNTLAWEIYKRPEIYERHRHRYGVNPRYIELLEKTGLVISGFSDEGYPEIIESKNNRFYLGIQAHPEFKSRPLKPSPVFYHFIKQLVK